MALDYEKHSNWQKWNNPVNWEKGCGYCKSGFEEEEKFVRIDVRVSIFRGDDEVHCFHYICFAKGLRALEKQYAMLMSGR